MPDTKSPGEFRVRFAKDRQKFAAAHFTIFPDGEVERLHGHNYVVSVTFCGVQTEMGLLLPFQKAKHMIQELCDSWDERVFLATSAPWLLLHERDGQIEARISSPLVNKFYSFPVEDVRLIDCNNISCENLALHFHQALARKVVQARWPVDHLAVRVQESAGQSVTYRGAP